MGSSLCLALGCECCKTGAQKRALEDGKVNEVTASGKLGTEKSAILTEYCNKYNIDNSKVAVWLDNHCTTTLVSEFIQSNGNDNDQNNENGSKALVLKENEIEMIILRCRNIDNGFESNAESIDNDSYGNDDAYLTKLGWEMLCNLIDANSESLKVIYMEGIYITKMRNEILCSNLLKCKSLIEIAFIDCSINFDKERHIITVNDASDSQGKEIERRIYDGAYSIIESTKDIESLMIVNLGDKETVSPEFEEKIDNLVENIKKTKKKFSFIY